jgi:hypothetical protein
MTEQDRTPDIDLDDAEGHLKHRDEAEAEDDTEGHLKHRDEAEDEDDTEGHLKHR